MRNWFQWCNIAFISVHRPVTNPKIIFWTWHEKSTDISLWRTLLCVSLHINGTASSRKYFSGSFCSMSTVNLSWQKVHSVNDSGEFYWIHLPTHTKLRYLWNKLLFESLQMFSQSEHSARLTETVGSFCHWSLPNQGQFNPLHNIKHIFKNI